MELTIKPKEILQNWGIESVGSVEPIQANVFRIALADGRQFVLKNLGPASDGAMARLQFEYDVLSHVTEQGLAVAVPLLSQSGRPYVAVSGELYRLSHWLPNNLARPQTAEELASLYRNYGVALGRFHGALTSYQDKNILSRTWQTTLQKRVLDEAVPVVLAHLEPDQLAPFKALLTELRPQMMVAFAELPIQLIIWDCHPGNVAVDGFDISGFIDCDHMSLAPRIFDLADFLVHLIKWDVGNAQEEATWLANIRQLIAGYESVSPLTAPEHQALYYALLGIPIVFMDFFLQANLPEPVKVELALLSWLAQHRAEIITQLNSN